MKPGLQYLLAILTAITSAYAARAQLYKGVDVTILSSRYAQTCVGIKPSEQDPQVVDFVVFGDNEIYGMRRGYRLKLGSYENGVVSWPGYGLALSSFRYYPAYAFPVINLKDRLYSQLYTTGYETYFLFYNLNDTAQNYERFYYGLAPFAIRTVVENNNLYFLTGACDGYDSTGVGYDEFGLDNDSLYLLKFNPQSKQTDTAYTFLNGFNRGRDVRKYWGDFQLDMDQQQMLLLSEDTLLTYNFGSASPVSTRAIPPEFFEGIIDPTVSMLNDTVYRALSLPAEGDLQSGVHFLALQQRQLQGNTVAIDTLTFYLPDLADDLTLSESSHLKVFGKMESGSWYGTIGYYSNLPDSSQATLLIKYDEVGNILWARSYFEDKYQANINAMYEGADGSLYLGGAWQVEYYQPFNFWWPGTALRQIPFIMRLDKDGFPITPLAESEFEIYPNPVRYALRLFAEQPTQYRIYTMAGVLQKQGTLNPARAEQDIVVEGLEDGLYLLSVKNLNGSYRVSKFEKISR